MGDGRVRRSAPAQRTRPPERRLQRLPLVPRHGARVLRGRRHRRVPQRALRVRQGVDREERPDVDAVYMEAVQAATGQGGWPMTVFLTPEAEPFYFGTYFPPVPRHGMPSFRQVLEGVAAAWRDRREEVGEVAGNIVRELSGRSLAPWRRRRRRRVPREAELAQALLGLTREYDEKYGGFGGAPKFPVHGGGVPAAAPRQDRRRRGPPDGRRHLRGHGAWRYLRPARRRVRALLRRPRVGRAPLREDALRQCAPVPRLRPPVAGHRQRARPAGGAGDRRLHGARAADARGRLRLRARRRLRRRHRPARRRRLLRVDARAAPRGPRGGGRPLRRRVLRGDRGRHVRAGRLRAAAAAGGRRRGRGAARRHPAAAAGGP